MSCSSEVVLTALTVHFGAFYPQLMSIPSPQRHTTPYLLPNTQYMIKVRTSICITCYIQDQLSRGRWVNAGQFRRQTGTLILTRYWMESVSLLHNRPSSRRHNLQLFTNITLWNPPPPQITGYHLLVVYQTMTRGLENKPKTKSFINFLLKKCILKK